MMEGFDRPQSYLTWSTRQIISWFSGLDDFFVPYLAEFQAKGINGKGLSTLTADSLIKLGVIKVGHQMVILERIKQLQNQFLSFDNETLQSFLFRVFRSCMSITAAINPLLTITKRQDNRDPDTESAYPGILLDIQEAATYVLKCILFFMTTVSNTAFWLGRPPFSLLPEMTTLRQYLIENAVYTNRSTQLAIASQLSEHYMKILVDAIKDYVSNILQNCADSIILTPCGMELVQIRKVDSEDFGFHFHSTLTNAHVIVSVQEESPAFCTGKFIRGDEVIEVNDQIVIGWLHYRVVDLMRLSPRRVCLRLKKRPAHSNDFIGFPGGGGGRHHRLMIHQTPPAGSLSQMRGGYIFTRNPKRRTPLTDPLVTETLQSTQESLSDQTSISSPTCTSHESNSLINTTRSLSPTELPSLSGEEALISIHLNSDNVNKLSAMNRPKSCFNNHDDGEENNNLGIHGNTLSNYSDSRLSSSSPNTPIMTLRVNNADSVELYETRKINANLQSNSNGHSELNIKNMKTTTDVKCISHHRTSFGDLSLLDSLTNQNGLLEASYQDTTMSSDLSQQAVNFSQKFEIFDKRLRNLHRGSFDDILNFRKLGFGSKKPTRRISCKDLGQGDCQGWLWLKKSNAFTSKYVKRWCIYKNSTFYYYRNPEDDFAEGLILIHGFRITPVNGVKNGKFAFYILNDWVRFIFASDSELDRSKWMNKLGLASIGISSSVPTSRIGGFNPGYVLGTSSKVTEIKTKATSNHSGLSINSIIITTNNNGGGIGNTKHLSQSSDINLTSLAALPPQPYVTSPLKSYHCKQMNPQSLLQNQMLSSSNISTKRNSDSSLVSTGNRYTSVSSEFIVLRTSNMAKFPPSSSKSKCHPLLGSSRSAYACYSESEDDVDDKTETNHGIDYSVVNEDLLDKSLNIQSCSLRVRPSSTSPSNKHSCSRSWNQTKAIRSLKNLKELLQFGNNSYCSSKHNVLLTPLYRLRAAQRIPKAHFCSDSALTVFNNDNNNTS